MTNCPNFSLIYCHQCSMYCILCTSVNLVFSWRHSLDILWMNDWFNCSHGHPAGVWRLALQSEQSIWRHLTASANRREADHHADGLCWTNGWCSQVYSCRSNVYCDLMKCVCWRSWTVSTALCVANTVTVIGSGSSTSPQRNTSTEWWAEREKTRACPGPIASLDPVSPSVPGTPSSSQWTWSMMKGLLKNSSDWLICY